MCSGDLENMPKVKLPDGNVLEFSRRVRVIDVAAEIGAGLARATLAAQLDLTIKTGVTTCTNAEFDTDGAVIYGPADLGSIAGIDVIGDPAQGDQGGERTLAASANEDLCFNVELPSATNDTFQGLTTTATFTFEAEQTSSNP